MLSAVAFEFVTPRLLARFGYRRVLAAGLVLLGLPALALPVGGTAGVLAGCLLRGLGLAIIFVGCGALGAALIPAERRGEGLGVFGVVVGLPAVIATPLGVWLAGRYGFTVVFVAAALTALVALSALPTLPNRLGDAGPAQHGIMRAPALVRLAIVFALTAVASGVVVTFLPAALPSGGQDLAAAALLVNAIAGTAARWWAGRLADKHGARRLFVPGVVITAAGMLALVLVGNPVALFAGMVLVGAGFGTIQNVSLTLMLDRVDVNGYGAVSALWSVAYDAGYGIGALGVGIVASHAGFPPAFALTAVLIVTGLTLARK
jgi:predicted MFS family arabinose efflux permease